MQEGLLPGCTPGSAGAAGKITVDKENWGTTLLVQGKGAAGKKRKGGERVNGSDGQRGSEKRGREKLVRRALSRRKEIHKVC